jgi:hypothetical protein
MERRYFNNALSREPISERQRVEWVAKSNLKIHPPQADQSYRPDQMVIGRPYTVKFEPGLSVITVAPNNL